MTGAELVGRDLGPYRLERLLGEGALGLVFSATRGDERVALKLLRPEHAADSAALGRFRREARVARGIESRHIVPVLEVGRAEGLVYLEMPYYEGGSLAQKLRKHGPLAVDQTLDLAAALGRGLDELHRLGVVHRDIKPSNVLLDSEGVAGLSDFGLARSPDSTRITAEGQILGTPHYLAPELIEGREATVASDIYALGCLLYECLTGAPPFAGRGPAAIGFAHLAEEPPDPESVRPEISTQLGEAVLLALEKAPASRPTSGTALARLLHAGRSASPV